ncbi:hypothetical protein FEO99_04797 [Burkholderia multivorans]|nr:hypothetical protein [Burkholderia multivorans]
MTYVHRLLLDSRLYFSATSLGHLVSILQPGGIS